MSGFPAGETVTIVRPTTAPGPDVYGNDVPGSPVETEVPGCAVAPAGTSEDAQGRDQVSTGLSVWLPHGTDISATDRVRVRGQLYEVSGTPETWQSPFTGSVSPVQISLSRVVG